MNEIFSDIRELLDDYRVPVMRNEDPAEGSPIIRVPILPVISITKINEGVLRLNSDVDVSLWDWVMQSSDDPPTWVEFKHGAGATNESTLTYDGSPGFVRIRILRNGLVVDSNSITLTGIAPSIPAPDIFFDFDSTKWVASIAKTTQPTEPTNWEFAQSDDAGWIAVPPVDPAVVADSDLPDDSRPLDVSNWRGAVTQALGFCMARYKTGGAWSDWSVVGELS